ncbi:DegT/DnrJ/EryC1/StrS family aminotransferase [Desulfovibrio inopinatus]|uniref:DegT/DnrJ/EryC1/StrS family aminotransferase n=1 Tax=Desulfovibrio inopinatus TaxID=102109 RepID=UPI000417DD26|nr:DegT/DnrJ/EryC1/StrS family aminotransferase [Desulfovibrio inopinatus]
MEKYLAPAHVTFGDDAIDAAVAVLRSGQVSAGQECRAFEAEFTAAVGARHAVSCASGTAALLLSCLAVLQPGDEVLVPGLTFFATAGAVVRAGCRPVFCDIDPKTFLMDMDDAAQKLTPQTRAIIPVHLFGNPCDADVVCRFAETHGVHIIWDAAQAHGARFRGRDVGSLSGLCCYSFYPTKNVGTAGEGGMVTTQDETLAERIRCLANQGQRVRYEHVMSGLNERMSEVEAAIGRVQLGHLKAMLAKRRRNASRLHDGLCDIPGLHMQTISPHGESAWHQFCVCVDAAQTGVTRDMLATQLAERHIGTAIHYPKGVHEQPAFEQMATALPVTESVSRSILALPVHHGLTDDDVDRIVWTVREIMLTKREGNDVHS